MIGSSADWKLTTTAYAHQRAAIEKLSQLKVGALFMDMGTGKTRTALGAHLASQEAYCKMCLVLSRIPHGGNQKGNPPAHVLHRYRYSHGGSPDTRREHTAGHMVSCRPGKPREVSPCGLCP